MPAYVRDRKSDTAKCRNKLLKESYFYESTAVDVSFYWGLETTLFVPGLTKLNLTTSLHQKHMKTSLLSITAALLAFAGMAIADDHKKAKKDIVDTAAGIEDFSTLVAAVKAGGLVETLKGDGPFTVFAPTNDAFAKLPEGTVESLLKPENKEKLVSILTYHVVAGKVMAKDVKAGEVATVNGKKATIAVKDGKVTIDGANVVKTDVGTSNGVIHVIDAVILPKA